MRRSPKKVSGCRERQLPRLMTKMPNGMESVMLFSEISIGFKRGLPGSKNVGPSPLLG